MTEKAKRISILSPVPGLLLMSDQPQTILAIFLLEP